MLDPRNARGVYIFKTVNELLFGGQDDENIVKLTTNTYHLRIIVWAFILVGLYLEWAQNLRIMVPGIFGTFLPTRVKK